MRKGVIGIIMVCLMISCFSVTALANPEGTWRGDEHDWQYQLSDETYLENDWIDYKDKWYYVDEDGYMVTGTRRIHGKNYYFRENGEMAVGWAYDDDTEKWYFMNDNGTRKTGWFKAGGVWYWFDSQGAMYNQGFRMVSGHKYYFFENGQMASNQYVGTYFYDADGLRNRKYDMTIQGERKPTEDEKNAISNAMQHIPGEWLEQCLQADWEFMYYTDKEYYEAPKTDQGIYYVYHKTDTNYKKIKFTKPEALPIAFGEYVAGVTGNNKQESTFMVDFQRYLSVSENNFIQPLPSYFDDKPSMWFGLLFASGIDPEIFYDMKKQGPDLAEFIESTLNLYTVGRKPTLEELRDNLYEESEGEINAFGPSTDRELGESNGPASDGGPIQ